MLAWRNGLNRDLIMPLDAYAEDGTLDFTNVSDGELDGGRIAGALYGVNLGNNSGYPSCSTWTHLRKPALSYRPRTGPGRILKRLPWRSPKRRGGKAFGDGLSNEQLWKSLYLSHGERAYSDDGTALGYEDDTIFADYIDMILRLQDAGAVTTREEEVALGDQGVETKALVTQDAAMDMFWSNQIVAVQSAAGEDRNLYMNHLPRGWKAANRPTM